FVDRGVEDLLERWNSGDVGTGQSRQVADVRRAAEQFFAMPPETVRHYRELESMQKQGLVTYSYLGKRVYNLSSIRNDPRGAKRAFTEALEMLVDTEELVEVDRVEVFNRFKRRTRTFARGPKWEPTPS